MWLSAYSQRRVILALPLSRSSDCWCEGDVATGSWIPAFLTLLPACVNMRSTGIYVSYALISAHVFILQFQVTCFHTECHFLFLSLWKHAQLLWGILSCSGLLSQLCMWHNYPWIWLRKQFFFFSSCMKGFLSIYKLFCPEGNLLLLVI